MRLILSPLSLSRALAPTPTLTLPLTLTPNPGPKPNLPTQALTGSQGSRTLFITPRHRVAADGR